MTCGWWMYYLKGLYLCLILVDGSHAVNARDFEADIFLGFKKFIIWRALNFQPTAGRLFTFLMRQRRVRVI